MSKTVSALLAERSRPAAPAFAPAPGTPEADLAERVFAAGVAQAKCELNEGQLAELTRRSWRAAAVYVQAARGPDGDSE
jgi:hypothetical protein